MLHLRKRVLISFFANSLSVEMIMISQRYSHGSNLASSIQFFFLNFFIFSFFNSKKNRYSRDYSAFSAIKRGVLGSPKETNQNPFEIHTSPFIPQVKFNLAAKKFVPVGYGTNSGRLNQFKSESYVLSD